jgi:predicted GNAT superfamily acetyltransferase
MGAAETAWETAGVAAVAAGVALVPMRDMADAVRLTGVVGRVWGDDELRPSLARALQHAGCGVFGAVHPSGELVGFVLGFLGWEDGLHMHSHMLAVLPEYEGRGIGYALKLAQRAACLDAGIDEVRWTFDPLVPRNGWFNLVRLGTAATAFYPSFYGEMSDRINRGDRSDRFEVRWRLGSDRVERAVSGRAVEPEPGPILLVRGGDETTPRPGETGVSPGPGAVVEVPLDHGALRARDPSLGREWREASARVFQACFDAGLVAVWIDRAGRYVFVPERDVRA